MYEMDFTIIRKNNVFVPNKIKNIDKIIIYIITNNIVFQIILFEHIRLNFAYVKLRKIR